MNIKKPISKIILYLLIVIITDTKAKSTLNATNQSLNIQSNTFFYDQKNNIAIYEGMVIAEQDSKTLKANKLTITGNNQDDEFEIIAYGSPATLQTMDPKDNGEIIGKGEQIKFNNKTQIFVISENAVITKGRDSFKAQNISYDIQKGIIKTPPSANGRTQIILQSIFD